ncbi:4Fe-4S double cluster binding domain-containing protein [Thermodesulfobacteriota bacterium]
MTEKGKEEQLPECDRLFPEWLASFMQQQGIVLWGAADLRNFNTPKDPSRMGFPGAIAFAIPMTPAIMAGIQQGPNQAYANEYTRVNTLINETAAGLETEIKKSGYRAQLLAASERTDPVNIKGDFPHKTAATRAGLGWIGRHCQLITRTFGSWVRLGTVFTDMALAYGMPVERSYCGTCMRCVEACPAGALKGSAWVAGMPREKILDVEACDRWKKENYYQYHKGHNCGICSAVCPYSLKRLNIE